MSNQCFRSWLVTCLASSHYWITVIEAYCHDSVHEKFFQIISLMNLSKSPDILKILSDISVRVRVSWRKNFQMIRQYVWWFWTNHRTSCKIISNVWWLFVKTANGPSETNFSKIWKKSNISLKKRHFKRPDDATWQQRPGSTLAQVMAWSLAAPNHYLNQYWLIIRGQFHRKCSRYLSLTWVWKLPIQLQPHLSKGQWVNKWCLLYVGHFVQT